MKKLTLSMLTCGLIASSAFQLSAATMRLSADNGATWVTVDDNDPILDQDPTPGSILYIGPVSGWAVTVATGLGSPAVGTAITPRMDLGTVNQSTGPANLIVQMSDTNFIAFPNEIFVASIIASTPGTVTYNTYRDSGNVLFGTTATSATAASLLTEGPMTGTQQYASNAVVVPAGSGLYSLTLETVIVQNSGGFSSTDALLYPLPPPPCNCTLTFISPQSFTNCAGDVIPDAVAVQDCGPGLSNTVPVTVTGAVTNGSCPSIITRTNTATDNCGNVYTFVQTITVNCRGNICGHVFADCDGNGDLTSGDVGVSNVIVSLLDSANHLLGKTTSDKNGGYCFTNLAGGSYVVSITPPSGYCQTAASTSYHWRDSYGRTCWQENDGYIHCISSGTECWWDKNNTCHWKDSYNRDCWKDYWGVVRCQPLSYKSCNAQTNNNCISVTLTNCASQTDVDFAYTGTKPSVSITCSGPSYVKCGQTYTYTCTVVNTGNVCFKGGNVCTTIGNCNYWGGWNYGCNSYTGNCPPLSPGQKCTFTVKCSFNSWNCGTVTCQSQVNCNNNFGNCYGQTTCYSQCSW